MEKKKIVEIKIHLIPAFSCSPSSPFLLRNCKIITGIVGCDRILLLHGY